MRLDRPRWCVGFPFSRLVFYEASVLFVVFLRSLRKVKREGERRRRFLFLAQGWQFEVLTVVYRVSYCTLYNLNIWIIIVVH